MGGAERRRCARCGEPTAGAYCRNCRGWAERVKALLTTAERDGELLRLIDVEKRRKSKIAKDMGVSRMAVGQRLRRARRRQEERAKLET